ncbi:receptor-like protein kinase ANXUR2 [Vitis vinifera]|uniref:receptor-like protein kinase ANXUR2 n=1 Tax=Vitis vinifera TaxID=29760 RepID=UPI0008FF9593|nr:receptor-like protein kinase ANXUR2 [Vitis vinifera]|eukprot:XP_019081752.1 PREDICTED: receptor-like protein kinase ANXUR2 [Vitis vinifera]
MPLSIPPPQLRLTMESSAGKNHEFWPSRFHNLHLVPLISCCDHPQQWLEIGIGAVWGLKHLHQGSECEIIHQDIKTTDISLDEKRVAKFADFGVVLFEVLCAGLAVEGSLMKERSLRGTETKVMQCYAEVDGKGFEISMGVFAFYMVLDALSENG